MRSTMVLTRGTSKITLDAPQFGYSTVINLGIVIGERRVDGTRPMYDNGASFDSRVATYKILYRPSYQRSIQEFLRLDAYGRGISFSMEIPDGMCPFGPDLSSYHRFPVQLVSFDLGAPNQSPWLWSESSLQMILLKNPVVTLPPEVKDSDGALSIGPVDGLRFPPSFYGSSRGYGMAFVPLTGPSVQEIDSGETSDYWESSVDVSANSSLTAKLVNYLVTVARTSEFTVACCPNSYMFGLDKCSPDGSGHYRVQLIDPAIEIMNVYHEVFVTRLKLLFRKFDAASTSSSVSRSSYSGSSESKSSASLTPGSDSSSSASTSSPSISSFSRSSPSDSSPSGSSSSHSSSLWVYF